MESNAPSPAPTAAEIAAQLQALAPGYGPTPLLDLPALAARLGVAQVLAKDAVEAAVAAPGGRVQDAWVGASEWSRDSDFLLSLAGGLSLSQQQVDDMFRAADAIRT
jgi:hypothetical protein